MNSRYWFLLAVVIGLLIWRHAATTPSPAPESPAAASRHEVYCPPPPRVKPGDPPLQTPVPASMQPVTLRGATLKPLAGFSVDARVLSRMDYRADTMSDWVPLDLALGWGNMRRDDVLSRLHISQSNRWYFYRWHGTPPLPPREIIRSSANMHLIPANAAVAREFAAIRQNDSVHIQGWLVELTTHTGWRYRSSTTREDTGSESCELILVCSISRN
ncbi:MAG: hypothetical protein LBV45_07460 [Xanthomonadaceae bacterium]|jgi:hypothetical protein|nr:hypothetical protein [Xanthomonadaceae bacterium]